MCLIGRVNILAVGFALVFSSSFHNYQLAKANTGSVSGVVYDQVGSVIVNAKIAIVEAFTPSGSKIYETRSDVRGEFKLENVSPGTYVLSIEASGFDAFTANSVKVSSDKTTKLDMRLGFKAYCDGEGVAGLLTDEDKASLVRQTLEHVFIVKDWPGPVDMLEEGEVFLREDNIELAWVQKYLPKKVTFLSKSEMHKGASVQSRYYYVAFSKIEVKGNCATIVLTHGVGSSKHTEDEGTLGTGSYVYEFRRMASRWIGKYVGGWIS